MEDKILLKSSFSATVNAPVGKVDIPQEIRQLGRRAAIFLTGAFLMTGASCSRPTNAATAPPPLEGRYVGWLPDHSTAVVWRDFER